MFSLAKSFSISTLIYIEFLTMLPSSSRMTCLKLPAPRVEGLTAEAVLHNNHTAPEYADLKAEEHEALQLT